MLSRLGLKASAASRRVTLARASKRFSSSAAADQKAAAAEMLTWKRASIVAMPVVAGFGVYGYVLEQRHHAHDRAHPFVEAKAPYLNIATKKWPWKNKQCTFWDMDCHKAADLKAKMAKH